MMRIPNTSSWQERVGYSDGDEDWTKAKLEYIAQFNYRVNLRLGSTYSAEFEQFHNWCEQHLGTKFKDWFMITKGKGVYTLFSKDNKWAMFLVLTYVDNIVD